jgi:hypothetical protein
MHLILYSASGAAVLAGLYRRIADGPDGEVVAAITWLAACVLLAGGAIVHAIMDRR